MILCSFLYIGIYILLSFFAISEHSPLLIYANQVPEKKYLEPLDVDIFHSQERINEIFKKIGVYTDISNFEEKLKELEAKIKSGGEISTEDKLMYIEMLTAELADRSRKLEQAKTDIIEAEGSLVDVQDQYDKVIDSYKKDSSDTDRKLAELQIEINDIDQKLKEFANERKTIYSEFPMLKGLKSQKDIERFDMEKRNAWLRMKELQDKFERKAADHKAGLKRKNFLEQLKDGYMENVKSYEEAKSKWANARGLGQDVRAGIANTERLFVEMVNAVKKDVARFDPLKAIEGAIKNVAIMASINITVDKDIEKISNLIRITPGTKLPEPEAFAPLSQEELKGYYKNYLGEGEEWF